MLHVDLRLADALVALAVEALLDAAGLRHHHQLRDWLTGHPRDPAARRLVPRVQQPLERLTRLQRHQDPPVRVTRGLQRDEVLALARDQRPGHAEQ